MTRKLRAPVRQRRPERGPATPPPVAAGSSDAAHARIACIVIPLFPLAARLRCEPELQPEGLAIFEGDGHQARVVAATRPARNAGVRPGMTLAQARARMPRLVARSRDPECERTAHEVLLEVAETFSPRVEDPGPPSWGTAYFEVGRDLRHARIANAGSAAESPELLLAEAVIARLAGAGLPARVGIASSKLAARVAAGLPRSPHVVPEGGEAEFLAPLPLHRLSPDAEAAETLARWGITSIGALARLPKNEIASRLGEVGRRLHAIAHGLDPQPLVAREPPPVFREGMTLEWPIVQIEPLLFLARGALERLVGRLDARGFGCKRLEMSLPLEPDGYHERSIELPSPTRDPKTLLTLLRLDLEAHSPEAPVRGFQLTAHPDAPRLAQLSMLGPASLSPDRLAETLARLFALLGPGRIGSPRSSNGHLPERFQLVEYTPPPPPKVRPRPEPGRGLLAVRVLRPPVEIEVTTEGRLEVRAPALDAQAADGRRPSAARDSYPCPSSNGGAQAREQQIAETGTRDPSPIDAATAESGASVASATIVQGVQTLAREPGIFRAARGRRRPVAIATPTPPSAEPPAPRVAHVARDPQPARPRPPRIHGKVRVASGPWELEERWWAAERTERDYWDVELEDGALYRIYRDRRSDRWFADGVYD